MACVENQRFFAEMGMQSARMQRNRHTHSQTAVSIYFPHLCGLIISTNGCESGPGFHTKPINQSRNASSIGTWQSSAANISHCVAVTDLTGWRASANKIKGMLCLHVCRDVTPLRTFDGGVSDICTADHCVRSGIKPDFKR